MTGGNATTPAVNNRAAGVGYILLGAFLLIYPWVSSSFWAVQIGAQTLILGVIALSLTLLAGYGGMVSLAQLSVAGCAGYMVAILGVNSVKMGLGWPWWAAVVVGILIAVAFGTLIGILSVRTEGIYTIMITLAISVGFFFFVRQNYPVFNGWTGFAGLAPPTIWGLNLRDPVPFFYMSLAVAAISYFAVVYMGRSAFGLSLQGIRDNERRMRALGFNVTGHRILAYTIAALIAAPGGILMVWLNGRISSGTVGIGPTIDILIIAVVGGLGHPIGAFIGALLFILLENFAIDLIDRERFNLVIGIVFLAIVLFSPDGVLGIWQKIKAAFNRRSI